MANQPASHAEPGQPAQQPAQQPGADAEEDPRELLKKEWEEAVRKTRPRDAGGVVCAWRQQLHLPAGRVAACSSPAQPAVQHHQCHLLHLRALMQLKA